ncbi:MAG: trigger factor [Victivallaceae bacterium]|nr:trigger factor [Victivallaceae bacterium]
MENERFFFMANKLIDSIKLEVRDAQPCRKAFDFTIPADAVKSEAAAVLSEFAGMVAVPGFRQGKAPAGIVKTKFAAELKEELHRRIMTTSYDLLLKDKTVDLLTCDIENEPEMAEGADFKFTLAGDIAPEFELGDYNSIKVETKLDEVTDKQLDERLDFFRKMYGAYAVADTPAEAEDMLKVSYVSDFKPAEDASASLKRQGEAKDTFVWLCEPESIPGCIKALTGATKGAECKFEAQYPADYRESELAGKKVNYTVTVEEIQRRKPLDDAELVEKARVKSIDEFKDMLRKSMIAEKEQKRRMEAVEAVWAALDKQVKAFELPPRVLAAEIQKELTTLAQSVRSAEEADKFKAELESKKAEAEKTARAALRKTFILRKIAQAEKIAVEQAEIEAQITVMSQQYGYPVKELRDMLEKNGQLDSLQLEILNGKVLEKLAEPSLK